MDILKFSLSGKTAFFKKPEVNTYVSFTFGNIHKIALLGIFGAILGYEGYASMNSKSNAYPEFYERLKGLNCSIVPKNDNGFIRKKIQQFNNSVGYASAEQGGNLIVKEQWLENPQWDIYVLLDCNEAKKIAESILSKKCVYIPYLGKNDHIADISGAKIIREVNICKDFIKIDSLYLKDKAIFGDIDDFEEYYQGIKEFKYEEHLPVELYEDTHMYKYLSFVQSNLPIDDYGDSVYKIDDEMIVFF